MRMTAGGSLILEFMSEKGKENKKRMREKNPKDDAQQQQQIRKDHTLLHLK
jgi:hypothetical protein